MEHSNAQKAEPYANLKRDLQRLRGDCAGRVYLRRQIGKVGNHQNNDT